MAQILSRKERERRSNAGTFLWGIGNAVGPGMRELLRRTREPKVLFSPIKGQPNRRDSRPVRVVAWTLADTMDGRPYQLPGGSLVTSRLDPVHPKAFHYALVCYSASPLVQTESGLRVGFGSLRNLTTGSRIGSSQVTAVVTVTDAPKAGYDEYPVAWQAALAAPYFIRLREPVDVELNALLHAVQVGSGPVRLHEFGAQ